MDEPPGYTLSFIFNQSIGDPIDFAVIAVLCLIWQSIALLETSFFTLTADDLHVFSVGKRSRDKAVMTLMNYPQHVQVTNLILRTAIKISILAFMILHVLHAGQPIIVVLLYGIIVCALVLLGEMLVKRFALRHKRWIVNHSAVILKFVTFLLMPITHPLLALQEWIIDLLSKRRKASEKASSRVLNETLNDIVSKPEERDLAKNVATFASLTVRQLMRQRKDVVAVEIASDFNALVATINQVEFSRIPVYRSTLDTIEGVIYTKDLIPFADQQKGFEWQKLLRPAFFVSENSKLIALLKDFQQKHVHIAVVVDKYGRVTGLITLQDLVEEVIDDINESLMPIS